VDPLLLGVAALRTSHVGLRTAWPRAPSRCPGRRRHVPLRRPQRDAEAALRRGVARDGRPRRPALGGPGGRGVDWHRRLRRPPARQRRCALPAGDAEPRGACAPRGERLRLLRLRHSRRLPCDPLRGRRRRLGCGRGVHDAVLEGPPRLLARRLRRHRGRARLRPHLPRRLRPHGARPHAAVRHDAGAVGRRRREEPRQRRAQPARPVPEAHHAGEGAGGAPGGRSPRPLRLLLHHRRRGDRAPRSRTGPSGSPAAAQPPTPSPFTSGPS
jgi:hypothetical protein